MLGLKLALFLSWALVVCSSEDLPAAKDASVPEMSIATRYVTCTSTWSCENCSTRKFCSDALWFVKVWYLQCPISLPYCQIASSGLAICTNNAPAGCAPSSQG